MQKYPEPCIGALILNRKGRILLCRSYKWGKKWTIPGGHIELGEKIADAVKREVKEEICLDVKPVKLLLVHDLIYAKEYYKKKHFISLDYLCKAKTTNVKLDEDEMQECVWVSPRKALKLNIDRYTRKDIKEYLKKMKK